MMKIDILSLFPEMFEGFLKTSIIKRAIDASLVEVKVHDFREFSKKNPKIYNENLEDISKEFSINKTKGSQFFFEQTNIDEETLFSTAVSEQQGVVLAQDNQNILTQKIANILSTGDDNISYNKVISNLSKKQILSKSKGVEINPTPHFSQ